MMITAGVMFAVTGVIFGFGLDRHISGWVTFPLILLWFGSIIGYVACVMFGVDPDEERKELELQKQKAIEDQARREKQKEEDRLLREMELELEEIEKEEKEFLSTSLAKLSEQATDVKTKIEGFVSTQPPGIHNKSPEELSLLCIMLDHWGSCLEEQSNCIFELYFDEHKYLYGTMKSEELDVFHEKLKEWELQVQLLKDQYNQILGSSSAIESFSLKEKAMKGVYFSDRIISKTTRKMEDSANKLQQINDRAQYDREQALLELEERRSRYQAVRTRMDQEAENKKAREDYIKDTAMAMHLAKGDLGAAFATQVFGAGVGAVFSKDNKK